MAGDIAAFPTITDVLVSGDNIQSYIAGADWKAGMVLAFHGTGVSRTLHPAVKGTTTTIKGVALYDVSSGDEGAVACRGCRCKVANFHDTTAIDAGDPAEDNDNAVGGTVGAAALTVSGVVAVIQYIAGTFDEDVAGDGTGILDVAPSIMTAVNDA